MDTEKTKEIKIQNCNNNNTIYNTKDWIECTEEIKEILKLHNIECI